MATRWTGVGIALLSDLCFTDWVARACSRGVGPCRGQRTK